MKIHNLAFLLFFQFPLASDHALESLQSAPLPDSQQKQKSDKTVAANIIFKSTDGGQTWQDISEGLPVHLQADGIQRDGFVEKDNELYVRAENGIYRSKPNSTTPFWEKEISPEVPSSLAPGKTGLFAYNYGGYFLQKINATSAWLPMFTNLQETQVRTVFETFKGTVFVGSDRGLFKSTNRGKDWKQVHTGGWVMKVVESNGVLLATSQEGIIRSTDAGENWNLVISEGGVGIAIERIKGGFAAITCNTESETRRVRTSYDGGKTWQSIDEDLPASLFIASIVQSGEYLFCGHPTGIFRSSDQGKTWKLILPSLEEKVFNLYVSGNVIYAIPRYGGC
ncbi:hypothetical protein GCM10027275_47680 [Rhabdobacter roseus]|uniref:Photosystem II stability/assembly factor-like uncharacterized protein n=1 Tax=Rhabdobacter roseus TaxID=1655419 RepID=A0A840U2J8_9BACT|nr:exo-alpha-sialidase [Rhabdobacter roseus]MBB5286350.1 photosystem II stability/assembly factor-like uncharacterized protein [Rhabdobacter roseus]